MFTRLFWPFFRCKIAESLDKSGLSFWGRAKIYYLLSNKGYTTIPFYYVNVDSVDTDISVFRKRRLDKTQLSVGDRVGFQDRQNNGIYGEIIRLNRKTVTLVTDKKHQWRVGYGALYRVIDGEKQDPNLLEGEIIDF